MKVRQFSIYKILTYMILTIAILEVARRIRWARYESWSSVTYWSTDKWSYIYRWDIDNIKVHSLKEPRHFKRN